MIICFALYQAEIQYLDTKKREELVKEIMEMMPGKIEHEGDDADDADEDGVVGGSKGDGSKDRLRDIIMTGRRSRKTKT